MTAQDVKHIKDWLRRSDEAENLDDKVEYLRLATGAILDAIRPPAKKIYKPRKKQ